MRDLLTDSIEVKKRESSAIENDVKTIKGNYIHNLPLLYISLVLSKKLLIREKRVAKSFKQISRFYFINNACFGVLVTIPYFVFKCQKKNFKNEGHLEQRS